MSDGIERESPTPYYEQLFAIIREQLVNGDIETDERLPSELELCREYGLSRATVRQTMSKLESEGFVRRVAHRGVFASAPEEAAGWSVQDAKGFLELQLHHGRSGVETQVIDADHVVPPRHVAEALRVGADERVFALERLRSMNGQSAMFSTNWFPGRAADSIASAPDVLTGAGSVNSTLRSAGFVTNGARRVVEALLPPERIAQHLRIDAGQPVLRVRSLSWDASDERFDYYETWVLTDVVPLEVNVAAN